MKNRFVRPLIGSLAIISLIGVDQLTKYAALHYLKGGRVAWLWPGVLELVYVENKGAAFGILQNQQWLFSIITAAVIVGFFYTYYRLPFEKKFRLTHFCAGLLIAGAIGNWIDRLKNGYVIDMIYACFIDFPVFNFADCLVVVGSVLFCLNALFRRHLLDDIYDELGKKKPHDAGTD